MLHVALTLITLAFLVLIVEILWHRNHLRGEDARKTYHILSSIYAATWPYYMTWSEIRLLGLCLITAILIIRIFKLFPGLYEIERHSWGELCIAVSVFGLGVLQPAKIVFVATALYIGLADGLAAVIGVRYGKGNQYKVLGNAKSAAGTLVFIVAALVVTAGIYFVGNVNPGASLLGLLAIPIALAAIENLGIYGIDNLFITVVTVGLFKAFNLA